MATPTAVSVHEMAKPPHHSGSLTGIGEWYAAPAIQAHAAEAPVIAIAVALGVDGRSQAMPADTKMNRRITKYTSRAYRMKEALRSCKRVEHRLDVRMCGCLNSLTLKERTAPSPEPQRVLGHGTTRHKGDTPGPAAHAFVRILSTILPHC